MKKMLIVMVGVILVISITACGGQPKAVSSAPGFDEEGIEDIEIEHIEIEDIEIEDIEIEDVEPIGNQHRVTWFTSGRHFGEPMPYMKVGVR